MGTRADFYTNTKDMKWLGSIAWDGYPEGIEKNILDSKTEEEYIKNVDSFLAGRDDKTLPEQGWPWPWDNSNTTDYSYSFGEDKVLASCFGSYWFEPVEDRPDEEMDGEYPNFPDMKDIQNVSFGKNSGVIIVGIKQ